MHRFKKVLYIILGLLFIVIIWFHELLGYGISQGYGQMSIIMNTKPVEEVLTDEAFPDSLKTKLRLIEDIRQFAFDSLGINYSENYTTFYDQKGKPILWVVTASEPFQLKAKEWNFPFLGSVSYKGFFNYEKAVKEAQALKQEGYDVSIDEVSGWSTLGWFKDPILSEMLKRSPGSLANLIIHELTHGTLYVKDDVRFNENLASFVGDKGAIQFLNLKYGPGSSEYAKYLKNKRVIREYTTLVLKQADKLDSLYNSFSASTMTIEQKKQKKNVWLKQVSGQLKEFLVKNEFKNPKYQQELQSLNNTYFIDYRRYYEDVGDFERELTSKFNSDLKVYLEYLKKKYPSL